MQFETLCLDDLVPENHKVRIVWDFVTRMDLSVCYEEIHSYKAEKGRPTIDPKILLALWIYTIIDGNISARKLEELCNNHNIYKWICGGVSVNRTSLAEFRSLNPRKFDTLLTECLAVMMQSGLLTDVDFSQDGTRIKGSAGMNTYRKEPSLKELQVEMSAYIEELKNLEKRASDTYEKREIQKKARFAKERAARIQAALETLNKARSDKIMNEKKTYNKVSEEDLAKVRASTTDPEIRRMKMGDGGYRLAYNVQFATGLDSRVIYGVDVVNTLDPGTPPRLMAQVQERLKKLKLGDIKTWIADAAYSSKIDIIMAATLFPNCIYYAPPKPKEGENPKQYKKNDCSALKTWRDRIGSESINEIFKKRCSTAEFSNMVVKNKRLVEFSVRGSLKVKAMSILHSIAFNVIRFMKLLTETI